MVDAEEKIEYRDFAPKIINLVVVQSSGAEALGNDSRSFRIVVFEGYMGKQVQFHLFKIIKV